MPTRSIEIPWQRDGLLRLLEEADRLLETPEPEDEAELGVYRSRIASVQRELAGMRAEGIFALEAVRMLARLAEMQRDFAGAMKCWASVREMATDISDESNFGLGVACQAMSDLDAAVRHFNAISDRFPSIRELEAKRGQIDARLSIERSISLAKDVVEMATLQADSGLAANTISAALADSRLPYRKDARVRELLTNAYDAICAYPEVSPAPAGKRFSNYRMLRQPRRMTGAKPKIIFTSGFLWSGSGAVTAMLAGYPGVEIAVGGREVGLFHHMNTLTGLLDAPVGSIGRSQLMYLFMAPVSGLLVDLRKIQVNRNKSLLKAQVDGGGSIEGLLAAGATLVDGIRQAGCAGADHNKCLLVALREFANEAIASLASTPDATVLMNNSIFAFHVRQLALFSDAVSVTVSRDPRDQYVAQYYERPRVDLPSVDAFIADTRRRYAHHAAAITELDLADRVIDVRFEDFVLNRNVREQVVERLNLVATGDVDGGSFDPRKSVKNIGIYKSFHDQEIIRKIEEAFPDNIYSLER